MQSKQRVKQREQSRESKAERAKHAVDLDEELREDPIEREVSGGEALARRGASSIHS
jgi:polysaccharide deacetylase 2 family uncharacterized protein YibQ